MLKDQKIWLSRVFRLIDATLIFFSFMIVQQVYSDRLFAHQLYQSIIFQQLQLLNVILWIYIARRFRLYSSRRMESFAYEIRDVILATGAAIAVTLVPLSFFSPFTAGIKFLAQVWLFQTVILVAFRFVLRRFLRYIRSRGYNFRRVLIVGCNERSAKLAQEIEQSPHLGFYLLGFIDAPNGDDYPRPDYPFKILGTLDDLEKISRENVIDEIFIRLPIKSFYTEILRILRFCEATGVEAKIPADLFNLTYCQSSFSREFGLSFIALCTSPRKSAQLLLHRWMNNFALRSRMNYLRFGNHEPRRLLFVGCNDRSFRLAQQIENSPELGLEILGFLDAPQGEDQLRAEFPFKILGSLDDLEKVSRNQVIDEIIVCLPIKSFYSEIARILQFCENTGVGAKIPSDLFNLSHSKSALYREFGLPVIDLYTSPKMSVQLLIKRVMDVFISLFLLIACMPLMAVVAVLIKWSSEGPVFFKQQRVGYNGRLFTLWKFRSMVVNADALKSELQCRNEMDGPVFKIKNDPRITRLGRFLRKTSIDELPQLWNVLRGDMSLVGPRPPVPCEVKQYILSDRRRLSMKPGITGVWQVCGRNCVPFDKWMEMDRQYIDEWSLWTDIKILAKTVPAVLRGTGS